MICEPHGRLRCAECAYVDELKSEIGKLRKALEEISDSEDAAPFLYRYRSLNDIYGIVDKALGKEQPNE